jgi:hypothetical protein
VVRRVDTQYTYLHTYYTSYVVVEEKEREEDVQKWSKRS